MTTTVYVKKKHLPISKDSNLVCLKIAGKWRVLEVCPEVEEAAVAMNTRAENELLDGSISDLSVYQLFKANHVKIEVIP